MAHVCPGCYKTAGAADDPDDAAKQTAVLRSGFAKGVISAPIDFDKGVDDQRPACDLLEPPTDAEAREEGFEDAAEWMAQSLGGGQQAEPLLRARLAELPPASEDSEKVDEDASGRYELWRFLETGGPSGEDFADDDTIDFVAAAYQAEARAARDKGAPLGRATGPGAAKASRAGSRSGGVQGEAT